MAIGCFAPITHHTHGETKVPVFPTWRHSFAADIASSTSPARSSQRQLADASRGLDADAVVYVHTEQFVVLCDTCWRSEQTDHANHLARDEHVEVGRIVAPPDIAARPPCRIYSPALCEAAGLHEPGAIECVGST